MLCNEKGLHRLEIEKKKTVTKYSLESRVEFFFLFLIFPVVTAHGVLAPEKGEYVYRLPPTSRARNGGQWTTCRDLLSHRGNGSHGGSGDVVKVHNFVVDLSVGGLLGAIARDVASLTALVAGLAGSVQGAAVRSSAIPGDVAELAASIALHGLGLAVASEVVGATALVAGSGTRAVGEASATIATDEATTTHGSTTAHGSITGVGASTL